MSAFIVSKAHIAALVSKQPDQTPAEIGQMLWQTNYNSVNYRYSEAAVTPVYLHTWPAVGRLSAVDRLSLLASYEYQSCEHPGWITSDARTYCQQLRHDLITELPGYAEAPWSI